MDFISCYSLQDSCGEEMAVKEFSVFSFILAAWSQVFESMMQGSFHEGKTGSVVIRDFSAAGVECFLRFLYSGVIEAPLVTIMEVGAIADKYGVDQLQELCVKAVRHGLTAENACELFGQAHQLHLHELREICMEQILVMPQKALQKRPSLSLHLLDEIFGSPLLCMGDGMILELLLGWTDSEAEAVLLLLNKHVTPGHIPKHFMSTLQPKFLHMLDRVTNDDAKAEVERHFALENCFARKSKDTLAALHKQVEEQYGPGAGFAGYCVSVAVSHPSVLRRNRLQDLASLRPMSELLLQEGDWVSWTLLRHSMLPIGFRLQAEFVPSCRVQVHGLHNSGAHLLLDTERHGPLKAGHMVYCRGLEWIRCFRITVLAGQLDPSEISIGSLLKEESSETIDGKRRRTQ